MRQDRLEAAAEVVEVVPVLMHLHSLPIVLDLRKHAIRTLLHRVLDGLAGLSLGVGKEKPGDLQVLFSGSCSAWTAPESRSWGLPTRE